MFRAAVATVVTLALAGAVVPAIASDDETLQARDFLFEPADVTIQAGDTVTFTIAPSSASHNFQFADGPKYPPLPSPPGTAWNGQSRTFTTPGTYTFVCGAHASMTGVVKVEAPAATPTPSPTGTPTPTGESESPPPEVRRLRMTASSFCTKRGKGCSRPGVKVQIDLSAAAAVSGTLKRRAPRAKRAKRFGRVDFGTVAAGPRTLTFTRNAAGRRLTAGRYKLALTVAGHPPQTLSFKVR